MRQKYYFCTITEDKVNTYFVTQGSGNITPENIITTALFMTPSLADKTEYKEITQQEFKVLKKHFPNL